MKIEVLSHASIKLTGEKVIYFDPYNIHEKIEDADYIFITHDHYDHYDKESINWNLARGVGRSGDGFMYEEQREHHYPHRDGGLHQRYS